MSEITDTLSSTVLILPLISSNAVFTRPGVRERSATIVPNGPPCPFKALRMSTIVRRVSSRIGLSFAMTEPMTSASLGISTFPSTTSWRPSSVSMLGMNAPSATGGRLFLPEWNFRVVPNPIGLEVSSRTESGFTRL